MEDKKQEKLWYLCPKCNKRILKYNKDTAKSERVYIKCKNCKEEVEIKIN